MIFTSYTYIAFLALAFLLHWVLPARLRRSLLVVLSYLFYVSWKWQFGFLLLGVSLFNWAFGLWLSRSEERVRFLWFGVVANLAPLVYFKYTGFLVATLRDVVSLGGGKLTFDVPAVVLPLGISFFTFQGIAYLVDVASGDTAFRRLGDFLLFKGFWPQLIAGPIVRPGEMREQIETPRVFNVDDVAWGLQRILQGFLKKIVLADNLAPTVELVFVPGSSPGAVDAITGIVGFGLQIYFDFSAYSDIAIGSARLFGYRFPENFEWPYLSASPREFWERWHMTLSRWIRDYLFTPMAFSLRGRTALLPAAVLGSMAICGLWHGAAWTFVIWGVWHGVLLVAGEAVGRLGSVPPSGVQSWGVKRFGGWALTSCGVFAGWAFFRAPSVGQAIDLLQAVVTLRGGLRPQVLRENAVLFVLVVLVGTALVHALHARPIRWRLGATTWARVAPVMRPVLDAAAVIVVIVADRGSQAFVYFQF